MKKVLSVILFAVCSFVPLFVLSFLNIFLASLYHMAASGYEAVFVVIEILVVLTCSFGITLAADVVRKKLAITLPVYFAVTYAPVTALNIYFAASHLREFALILTAPAALIISAAFWAAVLRKKSEATKPSALKKTIFSVMLAAGGTAAAFALMLINFLFADNGNVWGVVLAAAITLAATFGIDRLRSLFFRLFSVKTPLFWTLVYVPSLVIALGIALYSLYMENRYSGFGGLGLVLAYYVIPISTVFFALSGAFWAVLFSKIKKRI